MLRLLRRLFGAGVWRYYLGYGISRLSNIVILPIVSRELGPAGYGRFEVALSVLLASSIIVDAGFGAAMVRFVDDKEYSKGDVVGAAAALQTVASAVGVLALAVPLALLRPTGSSLVFVLLALLLYAYVEGYAILGGGMLRGEGRDGLYLLLAFARFAVTAGAGTLGAIYGGAAGALAGVAVGGVGFAAYAAVRIARARLGGTRSMRSLLRGYGIPLMASSVMAWTLGLSDRVFLKLSVSAQALGQYAANYRLGGSVAILLAAPLIQAWLPTARRAADDAGRKRMAARWFNDFTLVALGTVVALATLADVAVPVAFGDDYDASRLVIVAAGGSGWLVGVFYLVATPILLSTTTRTLVRVSLQTVAFTLAANAALIPLFGTRGAAAATVSAALFLCLATAAAVPAVERPHWLLERRQLLVAAILVAAAAAATTSTYVGIASGAAVAALVVERVVRSRQRETENAIQT